MAYKQYYKAYAPKSNPKEAGEEMKLEVQHGDGGMSFLDGRQRKRGLRVAFTPVVRSGFGESFTIPDKRAMCFHVTELGRQSPKKAEMLVDFVKANEADLMAMADNADWLGVHERLGQFELADHH